MELTNVVEITRRYPPGYMCADTIRVLHVLEEMQQGTQLTYADIEKRCGFSIRSGDRGSGYSRYATARKALLREKGYDFAPVANVGIRRLTDAEIVGRCERKLPGVRRAIKREQTKLASVASEKLTVDERNSRNTMATIYAFMRKGSSPDVTKRIEEQTREERSQLSFDAIVDLFARNKK